MKPAIVVGLLAVVVAAGWFWAGGSGGPVPGSRGGAGVPALGSGPAVPRPVGVASVPARLVPRSLLAAEDAPAAAADPLSLPEPFFQAPDPAAGRQGKKALLVRMADHLAADELLQQQLAAEAAALASATGGGR